MKNILAVAVLLLASMGAKGSDEKLYMPFPEARITVTQWQAYRDKIVDTFGGSLRQFPGERLEVVHSPDQELHFAFTTPGHPAHPAWVTRRVREGSVDQIGYFAGEERPFAELFRSYLSLTDRTIESIPDRASDP